MGVVEDIYQFLSDFVAYVWGNADLVAFLIVAALGIAAAIYVVTDKQPVHSAFYLALTFVTVAVSFFFLEAEFMGAIQLLVYVGAITVLFGFCIMLTRRNIVEEGESDE